MKKVIYLSPSNQYNKTCIDGYTEKMLMEPVAKEVLACLKKYDCTPVYTTVFNTNGSYTGRPKEAGKLGADIYVAIHSNSTGMDGAYAAGAVGYYYGGDDLSYRLAKTIQTNLDEACPISSNRASHVIDGMQAFNGYGYGELREPKKIGIVPVLIETNFHSYEPTCRYLLENPAEVGKGIADALVRILDIKPLEDETDPNLAPDTKDGLSVGQIVEFTGSMHYESSYENAEGHPASSGKAVVTRIITAPAKTQTHPVHLIYTDGGGSNVYGWVNRDDIKEAGGSDGGGKGRDFAIGDEVRFKEEAIVYYPSGSNIPDWVKNDYIHIITQIETGSQPVYKGGRRCVLLGKKRSINGGSIVSGINTWVDVLNLEKI